MKNKVRKNMIAARKKKNFTQADVAERLSVQRSTVARWELGIRKPDIEVAFALAEILDTSVEILFNDNVPNGNGKEAV